MLRRQPLSVFSSALALFLTGGLVMGQVHDHTRTITAAAPWSPPIQLSGHGAIGSPGGTHPLALGRTVYVAWLQNGVVHLATSEKGGVTWDHATRVTAHNTALYLCSLELSGPVLHLIWPDTRNHALAEPYYKRSCLSRHSALFCASSRQGGGTAVGYPPSQWVQTAAVA